jgi:hypothetical protein
LHHHADGCIVWFAIDDWESLCWKFCDDVIDGERHVVVVVLVLFLVVVLSVGVISVSISSND